MRQRFFDIHAHHQHFQLASLSAPRNPPICRYAASPKRHRFRANRRRVLLRRRFVNFAKPAPDQSRVNEPHSGILFSTNLLPIQSIAPSPARSPFSPVNRLTPGQPGGLIFKVAGQIPHLAPKHGVHGNTASRLLYHDSGQCGPTATPCISIATGAVTSPQLCYPDVVLSPAPGVCVH